MKRLIKKSKFYNRVIQLFKSFRNSEIKDYRHYSKRGKYIVDMFRKGSKFSLTIKKQSD